MIGPLPPLPRWRGRLQTYLTSLAAAEFAWGRNDCALFAAGAVAAMTGHDPAAAYRGRYRTAGGARRVLRATGHADQVALADSLFPRVDVGQVQIGDVVAVAGDEDLALGIVTGAAIQVMTPQGLAVLDLTLSDPDTGETRPRALVAWRVLA